MIVMLKLEYVPTYLERMNAAAQQDTLVTELNVLKSMNVPLVQTIATLMLNAPTLLDLLPVNVTLVLLEMV
jgi:hypothetical protein